MSILSEPRTHRCAAATQSSPVGYKTALCMIVVFVGLICIPAVHQLCIELKRTGGWRFLVLYQEWPTHASLKRFEETLARDSELATKARRLYRTCQMRWLGQGNAEIVVGHGGFLFLREEVEMAAGPGFLHRTIKGARGTDVRSNRGNSTDSITVIVDFERQLRALGIHLVFVPIPAKPYIYPEEVWPGYLTSAGPAWNRDREAFKTSLGEAGVDVRDVTDDLWRAKFQEGDRLFLKLDTHWTPRGLAVVADCLAQHVKRFLPHFAPQAYTSRLTSVTNYGDLLRILEVQPSSGLFHAQTVEITQLLKGVTLASGDDSSPVLLLGDSFTNIYHRKEMEWGDGAGLGEQLMLRLGHGVQVIAINGGGATAVRETLKQRPLALQQKHVVVWACSARDLYDESIAWERVAITKRD
jgi:alginate O-acetyltransferase complex protein AlgJ